MVINDCTKPHPLNVAVVLGWSHWTQLESRHRRLSTHSSCRPALSLASWSTVPETKEAKGQCNAKKEGDGGGGENGRGAHQGSRVSLAIGDSRENAQWHTVL